MYVRITYPKIQCFDSNGDPAVGYEIHTKKAGLSTALTTYSERTLTTPNTNPVILDARGEADIYVGEAAKLIFTIPNGDIADPIWSIDYVGEQQSNFVTGLGITATTNNYTVTTTPAVAALSNNFMLIMTPDEDNVTTLTSNVFTGTGVNDCTESGAYLGAAVAVFTIQIDGVATPDTFKWKKDGGAWTTGVAITGVAQTISEGLIVTFAVTTGHTLNDIWAITVQPPARVNLDTLGNLIVYKNKGGSVVALDGADMKNGYPAQLILNEALNAWLLINPATPTFSVPTITAVRYRKNITTDYTVLPADQGYELNCIGAFTLTLPTPPEFSGKFLYITNVTGFITTIDAGVGYKIYGIGDTTGSRYSYLGGNLTSIQLETNGVDWHILTTASKESTYYAFMTPGSYTWVCPLSWGSGALVSGCAGGAPGGGVAANYWAAGSGGGAGDAIIDALIAVVAGSSYTIVVGNAQGNTTISGGLLTLTAGVVGGGELGHTDGSTFAQGGSGQSGPFGSGASGTYATSGQGYPGKSGRANGAGGGGACNGYSPTGYAGGAGSAGCLSIRNAAVTERH